MNVRGIFKIQLKNKPVFVLLFTVLVLSSFTGMAQSFSEIRKDLNTRIADSTAIKILQGQVHYSNRKRIQLDSIYFNNSQDTLVLAFNKALAEMPIRKAVIISFQDSLKKWLPDSLNKNDLKVLANGEELNDLIPNYYRTPEEINTARLAQKRLRPERRNAVSKIRPYLISSGLQNSNLALWNSHGWYYEPKLDRWEWQRARLFTTVEDILPTAFVIPFIAPMLENAGATVFIPRERDWQTNEVIVDNDVSTGKSKFKKPKNRKEESLGFGLSNKIYIDENPFEEGTSIKFGGTRKQNRVLYLPEIPEDGEYGVTVSFGKGEGTVIYRVNHAGGSTDFLVDQRMAYGTWVFLDKFQFIAGKNRETGSVEIIVPEGSDKLYTADAVRFGGGMGVVERNGKTSGRAKFYEGARYYLQYAGAPDTLIWKLNANNDYVDDYMSRGEWVDWLIGAPFGPTKDRQYPGLGVPIDLAFAFHTDAGILPNDIVGTLGIYSTERDTSVFPDGQSKYASRDLTDLIQTQIVDDINAIYKCNWTRRGMWNSQYSEAYRPQVPTMLLELLSHQNLNDMRYALNPKFRFDVSRAIYKAMLRFVATQHGLDYVVQPLPVDHMASEFVNENSVKISWNPVNDPIEPTAQPEQYMVYKRIGDRGFDNGTLVNIPEFIVEGLEPDKIYSFKVTAVNAGGESFPSETLSVGMAKNSKGKVLIVNGFDKIDGPEIFDTETYGGVLRQNDHGVAYGYDLLTVGDQYDFDRSSPWLDDDSPGHGASYANLETTIYKGNTFDFSNDHGKSILAAGYSFCSASDEVVEKELLSLNSYVVLDLLYGEEKTTYFPGNDSKPYYSIYTSEMLNVLENYTANGGNLLITGAYIGSDIPKDTALVSRIGKLLNYKWRTDHAVKTGDFYSLDDQFSFRGELNTDYNLMQYPVESPDGIEPYSESAETIFRYSENNVSAGIFFNGKYNVVALGFPFESIKQQKQRDRLMKRFLTQLDRAD